MGLVISAPHGFGGKITKYSESVWDERTANNKTHVSGGNTITCSLKLPASNMLPNEEMTDINALIVGRCHRDVRQMCSPLVILFHRGTPNIATPKILLKNCFAKKP